MSASPADKLASFVNSLTDFVKYTTVGDKYGHIGAAIADAILQANNNYKRNVAPRTARILAKYPNAKTTSALLALLSSVPATEFLSWQGTDRAERFCQVVGLFKSEGVETEDDLRLWLEKGPNCAKLYAIHGIGPKTVDYFKILVGESTSAIDRHLLNFLAIAGIPAQSYEQAQDVINATADLLGMDRACFDYSIWQYMSDRAASGCKTIAARVP